MFDLKLKKFENSSVYFFLKNIEGFSRYNADCLCKKFGFTLNFKVKDLKQNQVILLKKEIKDLLDLTKNSKSFELSNIKKLIQVKSYKGKRHLSGLSVRGQNTKTNARTQKKLFKKRLTK